MSAAKSIQQGTYCHNKSGKLYEVVGRALHTETDEMLVIYKPLYESEYEIYARPLEMFSEQVEIGGKMQPRFEKIEPAE